MVKKVLTSLAACCGLMLFADTIDRNSLMLDSCHDINSWQFINGGEFPGAGGSVEFAPGKPVTLNFDFTNGGRYVGAQSKFKIPDRIKSFTLFLNANENQNVCVRLTDATGRVFQSFPKIIGKNAKKLTIDLSGKWAAAWEGKKSASPRQPITSIMLIVNAGKDGVRKSRILIDAITADLASPIQPNFTGQGGSLGILGWHVQADWILMATGIGLKLSAQKQKGGDAVLSVTFPQAARDVVKRYWLSDEESSYEFIYRPPIENGGNSRNIYQLRVKLTSNDGAQAEQTLRLSGKHSEGINFGKPVFSSEIVESQAGTCTHFSFGTFGSFKGWKPYRQLIDSISACGYKWIRDECRIITNSDGSMSVRPYDLEWMRYASEKKLKIILIIGMNPKGTIEKSMEVAETVVRQTRQFVSVYELGNEPNNTGWPKIFKGSWNGYEKDGTVSRWVKEHVKQTNAMANHIKKVCPGATVIGLGSCSPTNFHALNIGVTNNLDGVVDHPYTYSMPPEYIPYGHGLTKRDGIKIGDKKHSYAGLVNSYIDHFKKTGKMRTLWMTEFGFTTFWFNGTTEKGLYAGFTEEAQAVYLVRRFLENMALPVAVSCQYDFLDDYGSNEFKDESNFGIIRGDYSRKPAYFAVQRMNSLFNGWKYNKTIKVVVEKDFLHRSCRRSELIKKWDEASIAAGNGIKAFSFTTPRYSDRRMLAVWSVLPYSREFNNRTCTLRLKEMKDFHAAPVAIDLVTGISYDIPVEINGDDLVLKNLVLKGNPIVIKFFSNK